MTLGTRRGADGAARRDGDGASTRSRVDESLAGDETHDDERYVAQVGDDATELALARNPRGVAANEQHATDNPKPETRRGGARKRETGAHRRRRHRRKLLERVLMPALDAIEFFLLFVAVRRVLRAPTSAVPRDVSLVSLARGSGSSAAGDIASNARAASASRARARVRDEGARRHRRRTKSGYFTPNVFLAATTR